MRTLAHRLLAFLLAFTLMVGCTALAENASYVNVAVTGTIPSLNPLLMEATEVGKYAMSLSFLPLVELNADNEFVPQLAKSITTEDNMTFTIELEEDAVWSDGVPVTSKDVLFTYLLITSPEAGVSALAQYLIAGTDDGGHVPSGATSLEGVQIVDDKTLTITLKWPTSLETFQNNFGRYVLTLPEHILGSEDRASLLTSSWFMAPTVVSGPYRVVEADLNHYVRYESNPTYFRGEPAIRYLNMNVYLEPAQLLAGLTSGEIDLIQQTTGSIPLEDYEAVEALPNVTVHMGKPITVQSVFINVNTVPDVRIRQALLLGMDRQTILEGLVNGNGEVVDAFLCSASPFYAEDLGVTAYEPDKAAELIAAAAADGASTTLEWYLNNGDGTFLQAAEFLAAMYAEIGLTINLHPLDLDSLMGVAGTDDMDVMTVEYTYSPVDPYTDMVWLLSADGWTHYANPDLDAAFQATQTSVDAEEVKAAYRTINAAVQADCPMICAYVISSMGAVSNRLHGATPDVFGTFVNVHQWAVD